MTINIFVVDSTKSENLMKEILSSHPVFDEIASCGQIFQLLDKVCAEGPPFEISE
jgi:hypothetical protein